MNAMFTLSIRNLLANKLRFFLTTFAVILGVSFVVASFVLSDGLAQTFDTIVEESISEVDVEVRAVNEFDEDAFASGMIDEGLVDVLAGVDGVEEIDAALQSLKIVPVKANGDPIQTFGAPILSYNWTDSINPLTVVDGRAPTGPGEFAIDVGTADRENLVVGERYDLVGGAGRESFELVGMTRFGNENSLAGAVIVSLTLDEIQRLDDSEGVVQWIQIVSDGTETDVLIDRLEQVLPGDVEAVPGDVVVAESQDDFSAVVDIFGNVLLAFALVAVFVSVFIISNTFNILLGQRVRQLALIRALGASSAQVRFSALLESLLIGIVASVVGLGGGVVLALGLRELMNSLGFGLPSFDITLAPRTIIAAAIVGIGVTMMASLTPARRAATVPPVAAMRAGFRFGSGEGTRRTIIAIVLSVLGIAAVGYGVAGSGVALPLLSLGLGAVLIFVAVSMFAPLFSTPAASLLGAPLEHVPGSGITGHMARENSARNNKRTASTAAGLMIGLALIAMASVVAESLKESFRSELGSTMIGDYVITAQGDVPFTNQVADQVAALPEFSEVSAVRWGNFRVGDDEMGIAAGDLSVLTDLLQIDVQAGDPAASARAGTIILSTDAAEDFAVGVGDPLVVEFAATGEQTLTVGAIYENSFLIGHHVIDLATWRANFETQNDSVISARVADGVDLADSDAALAPLADAYPQLQFETQSAWTERLETELDSLVVIINVFLGLAIVIALLGIANTMALSVLERTREIGLMRAIGMTRRQTRVMIRLEAAIVSLFGALLGVVVGLFFGWVAVIAIPASVVNQLAIPTGTLAIYVVIATIAGVFAASFPARRAARLKILEAIAQE